MAPGAVKRAALEEYGGAEAGTVFGGEALEVEEEALRRGRDHKVQGKRLTTKFTKEHEGTRKLFFLRCLTGSAGRQFPITYR
jgi:hypothetical protein